VVKAPPSLAYIPLPWVRIPKSRQKKNYHLGAKTYFKFSFEKHLFALLQARNVNLSELWFTRGLSQARYLQKFLGVLFAETKVCVSHRLSPHLPLSPVSHDKWTTVWWSSKKNRMEDRCFIWTNKLLPASYSLDHKKTCLRTRRQKVIFYSKCLLPGPRPDSGHKSKKFALCWKPEASGLPGHSQTKKVTKEGTGWTGAIPPILTEAPRLPVGDLKPHWVILLHYFFQGTSKFVFNPSH
jgi:hypothetical protein